MSWQNQLKGNSLSWLLEPDSPGVRYLALRDLVDDAKETDISAAREAAHKGGPIADILENMSESGYWEKEGPGYNPKYRSTVWALIMLAQLGASVDQDERIALACFYFLDHALADGGQISASGAPSGTADCLQGNLCWALTELGLLTRAWNLAYEWMARTVTGEGLAPIIGPECALALLRGELRPALCLRFERQAALRLGRGQGHAGLRCVATEQAAPL